MQPLITAVSVRPNYLCRRWTDIFFTLNTLYEKPKREKIRPAYITISACAERLTQALNISIPEADLKSYLLDAKMIDEYYFIQPAYINEGFFIRKLVDKHETKQLQNEKDKVEIFITLDGLSFIKGRLRQILKTREEK